MSPQYKVDLSVDVVIAVKLLFWPCDVTKPLHEILINYCKYTKWFIRITPIQVIDIARERN